MFLLMLAALSCKHYFHQAINIRKTFQIHPMAKADRVFLISIVLGLAAIYSILAIVS